MTVNLPEGTFTKNIEIVRYKFWTLCGHTVCPEKEKTSYPWRAMTHLKADAINSACLNDIKYLNVTRVNFLILLYPLTH